LQLTTWHITWLPLSTSGGYLNFLNRHRLFDFVILKAEEEKKKKQGCSCFLEMVVLAMFSIPRESKMKYVALDRSVEA